MEQLVYVSIDRMKSPIIHELYAIWRNRCSGDRFPTSKDINPDMLPVNIKRYLLFMEIHQYPLKVFYLYSGKGLIKYEGADPTNQWLHEFDGYEAWDKLNELNGYMDMLYRNGPSFSLEDQFWIEEERQETMEWAIFPLSDDGGMITHAVSISDLSHLEGKEITVRRNYSDS